MQVVTSCCSFSPESNSALTADCGVALALREAVFDASAWQCAEVGFVFGAAPVAHHGRVVGPRNQRRTGRRRGRGVSWRLLVGPCCCAGWMLRDCDVDASGATGLALVAVTESMHRGPLRNNLCAGISSVSGRSRGGSSLRAAEGVKNDTGSMRLLLSLLRLLAISTAPADAWWVRRSYYGPVYIHRYYTPRVVVVPRYYVAPPVVYVRPSPYVIVR